MKMTKIGVGAAAAVFAGCAWLPSVGPDYEQPGYETKDYALPDAGSPTSNLTATCEYQIASSNADLRSQITLEDCTQWWKHFNDPLLDDLVEGATTNNTSLMMARKRLEQAAYELLGSYAAFMPKFTAFGQWNRNWYGSQTTTGSTADRNFSTANGWNVGVDGTWEIDIFGGSRRATQAAFAQLQASTWGVADTWVALTTQIGEQYINLRTAQERLAVARINLKLQSETYDILKSRLDSGIGDELAVSQCAYIVEQTRAKIPQLLAEEEALKNTIAILYGVRPGELHEVLKPLDQRRDWLIAPRKINELPLDLMRARPDVRQAEANLAAQTFLIGVAKSAWFPKLYINGSVGWQTTKRTRVFSADSLLASIGPSVSWPIFQGGAIYANVKATEAKMQELALTYELTIDKAYAELRNAYSAYTQEYHRYQSLTAAVKAATDAVTISNDLYKNGLKDFNNVLDAQRSRLSLEEQLVVSRGQITLDLLDLYKALGGGLARSYEEEEKE